jgi:hypothetical protein
LKASIVGRIASECLIEQEKAAEKLSKESKKLKSNCDLAQATNLDLEKKVAELTEALKKCQDDKKIADDGKKVADEVLKLLFKEYEKSLMNFGVRTTPLPDDIGISGMDRH